jgi:hypothetical protein
MFIRFPAPPGGLARKLTVSRSEKDGGVVITPSPSMSTQPPTAGPAPKPATDSAPSLPSDPGRDQPATKR